MVVCRFFLQGNCRFGANCRNEHPSSESRSSFQNQNQNRFAALQTPPHNRSNAFQNPPQNRNNAFQNPPQHRNNHSSFQNLPTGPRRGNQDRGTERRGGRDQRDYPYHLETEIIKADLTNELPIWPFSAYGPGRDAPRQLFGGELEQSPEEMRLFYYNSKAAGNVQVAIEAEQALYQQSRRQIDAALNDLHGAIDYIVTGKDIHPNRWDVVNMKDIPPGQASGNQVFGQPPVHQGAASNQAASSGQPGAVGPGAFFGQPTGRVQNTTFSQAAPSTNNSAFGQPSSMGQDATMGQPKFGLPSTAQRATVAQPTFGKPSASRGIIFGQTSNTGQSAFTNQTQGQGGIFGQASAQTSAFGQPDTQQSLFAQNQNQNQQTSSAFQSFPQPLQPVASNAFAQKSQAFSGQQGLPAGPSLAQNAFSQHLNGSSGAAQANGTGSLAVASSDDPRTYSTRDNQNRLLTWKGRPVKYEDGKAFYRREDNELERIFFPEGPPPQNPYTEELPDAYTDKVEVAYEYLINNDSFQDGVMPDVAPKREWLRFDI
ncbi:hypothetical protein M501DRAFT_997503 [Patellaria atrata CBS 101060]|uniref:C3H1-type domain-containing protein n=1 Tax=Patellaria atrata CBS 101060 TaxID=1346257 RepID=A0A9P4S441_9PEZI|nr:hypothetical protein M501DRAFT_997503 [Patellaria atrata CBS 101060]